MSRGDDEAAIITLHQIAKINGKETSITLDDLKEIDARYPRPDNVEVKEDGLLSGRQIIKNKLAKYKLEHIKQVFGY